ncbi:MAG: tryptophan synthase subunit alpha [Deltaproteobacteria bacterium]|nr:MAG: tryptophan synthase subunit alpha [Deltaproteobacteria bacterium]
MSRITGRFAELKTEGRCALVPYITAGDPQPDTTVEIMHTLVNAGADLLELGVPFSDPMADGPVIQAAHERALVHHTSLSDILAMVTEFRKDDDQTPVILMGYANPIERMGYEIFVERAVQAGVDGVLTVDLPPEEGGEFEALLQSSSLDPIFLLSPTTTDSRIKRITDVASGFVYYVSLKGVTGAGNLDIQSVDEKLAIIRRSTDLPVGVGFGISDAQSAASVAQIADAVVVGSALIRIIEAHQTDMTLANKKLYELVHSMREAIDDVRGFPQQKQAGL